jgi:hypothetical protein
MLKVYPVEKEHLNAYWQDP